MSLPIIKYDDSKDDKLQLALERANGLMVNLHNKHTLMSPSEGDRKHEDCDDSNLHTPSMKKSVDRSGDVGRGGTKFLSPVTDTELDKSLEIAGHGIVDTINSLVENLENSYETIQKLTFRNMILNSQGNDVQSKLQIENNLQKKELDRVQDFYRVEKSKLQAQLRDKDNKIYKYKRKIIEKNKEINRLGRILNDHGITDMPKEQTTKLKTLGILASQVLNDDRDRIKLPSIRLPKMKSFSTVDGTVRDIH